MTYITMVMRGALPDCSQKTHYTKEVTQHELARSAGLASRSTFTRRLALFANTAFWNLLQRSQHSDRIRRMRAAQGRRIRRDPRRVVPIAPVKSKVFHADRQFAMPNRYNCRLPITRGNLPKIFDFLETVEWSRLFDPRCGQENGFREAPLSITDQFPEKGFNGLKPIDKWIWSHNLAEMPGWMSEQEKADWITADDKTRLVLTFYMMCGLLDPGNGSGGLDETVGHRRPPGLINVGQAKVAWCCGLSVKSVYRANAHLVLFKLIRVAHPEPEIRTSPDGRKCYRRGPQRILYLPVRRFTPEEAQAEAERFARALHALENAIEGSRSRAFFNQALDIHAGLLRAWIGKEHSPKAFRHEICRQLLKLGMNRRHVRSLLPRPPD